MRTENKCILQFILHGGIFLADAEKRGVSFVFVEKKLNLKKTFQNKNFKDVDSNMVSRNSSSRTKKSNEKEHHYI